MGTCFNILSVSLSDMSERQLQTVRYFPKSYLRSSEWTSITKSRGQNVTLIIDGSYESYNMSHIIDSCP